MKAKSLLMRRREVTEYLGVDRQVVQKMVQCGVLKPVHLVPGGRAHYRRDEVEGCVKAKKPKN